MARMIVVRKELGSGESLAHLLEQIPIGVPHEHVRIEAAQFWEWGEECRRLVILWEREETENERLIRVRADKLRREAADAEQDRKDREEFARLSKKYGTSA